MEFQVILRPAAWKTIRVTSYLRRTPARTTPDPQFYLRRGTSTVPELLGAHKKNDTVGTWGYAKGRTLYKEATLGFQRQGQETLLTAISVTKISVILPNTVTKSKTFQASLK
jgi:hypothetical protein